TRESREIAQRIARLQEELAPMLDQEADADARRHFDESVKYWRRFLEVHDKVLALAEVNTNAKAEARLREQVAPQADAVVEPLAKLAELTDQEYRAAVAAKDAARMEALERRGRETRDLIAAARELVALLGRYVVTHKKEGFDQLDVSVKRV